MSMKKLSIYFLSALAIASAVSCSKESSDPAPTPTPHVSEYVYVLSEGKMGENNATLSRYDLNDDYVENDWFSSVNNIPLGDTGNDIITTDKYIIIAINGSNLIQFCDHDGQIKGNTEAVPSCRRMVADTTGKYLYVTSYAENGNLYRVNMSDFTVSGIAKTGYEPEGVVYYKGKLFVANTGGYAYSGAHNYEQTITVVDEKTMATVGMVKTGHYNLYGAFVQNAKYPRYVLVNAAGDYGSNPASSFIFDCETEKVVAEYNFPATYAAQYDGAWYVLGSSFDYSTYKSEYITKKIDMNEGSPVVTDWTIPDLDSMVSPYGIFITSRGGLFVTDAGDYVSRGTLYRYKLSGTLVSKETVGINPGHFAEY